MEHVTGTADAPCTEPNVSLAQSSGTEPDAAGDLQAQQMALDSFADEVSHPSAAAPKKPIGRLFGAIG